MSFFILGWIFAATNSYAAIPDAFVLSQGQRGNCQSEGLNRHAAHRETYLHGGEGRLAIASSRYEVVHEDRVYRQIHGQELSLTLYRPRDAGPARRYPVLLQLHGGGWIGGSRDQLADVSIRLAGMGVIVVSVDYRIAPRDLFPAAPDDVRAAADWIASHVEELGVDTAPGIAVFGFSAGANLAGMLAMTAGPSSGAALPVARAVLLSGRADLLAIDSGFDYSSIYLGGPLSEHLEAYRQASPIYQIPHGSSLPDVLFIHQTTDDVIPWEQSCRFEVALRANGGNSRLLLLPENAPAHGPTGENRQLLLQAMAYFLGLI